MIKRTIIILFLVSSCFGINTTINSFNAGELSPNLDAATGLKKYYGGARTLENFLVKSYGAAVKRPGSYYIAAVDNPVDVIIATEVFHPDVNASCTEIYTAEQFNAIRNDMGEDRCYQLMNDIDLSGYAEWIPMGTWSDRFQCKLDGRGFTVSGMVSTEVHNLGKEWVGRVDTRAQGLIGICEGFIQNIKVDVDITIPSNARRVGGLVVVFQRDESSDALYRCKVTGSISGFAASQTGGMIGSLNRGQCTECVSEVNLSFTSGFAAHVGGFVGFQNVFGQTQNEPSSVITDCYTTGNISAIGLRNSGHVGGFIGGMSNLNVLNGRWTNVYASGNAYCEVNADASGSASAWVGGFFGDCTEVKSNDWGIVTNCYGYGTVGGSAPGGTVYLGGFVSVMNVNEPQEINCHYKNNGNDADSLATQQVDSYFKAAASGVYTGDTIWDFNDVWEMVEGVSLPTLQWEGFFTGDPPHYTYAIETLDNPDIRLVPFEFSSKQAYVLEFGNQYLRFYKDAN